LTGPRSTLLRSLAVVLAILGALELVYVSAANAVLYSRVIQRAVSGDKGNDLSWARAYSPWPGRVYVGGLSLRVQDDDQQFRLTIERAVVDVVLWELLFKQFRTSRVRAEAVSFRFLRKVESTKGLERQLAAFPPIEGFESPAITTPLALREAEPSLKELGGHFALRLDGIEATIAELWFQQYRYQGPAQVRGSFLLRPGLLVQVGPALLELGGGSLQAGEHTLAPRFTGRAAVTFAPYDLATKRGMQVFRAVTGSLQLEAALTDLGATDLYLEGLQVRGAGMLTGRVDIAGGILLPGTALELRTDVVEVQNKGYRFAGHLLARLWIEPGAPELSARVTIGGELFVPLSPDAGLTALLSGCHAQLSLHDTDLAAGLTLSRLSAVLSEARVRDASGVTSLASAKVPLLAPLVLGQGPLVVSLSAEMTPEQAVVRLVRARLGGAELAGALRSTAGATGGWSGAAAGRVGQATLGLRVRQGKLSAVPLVAAGWLGKELLAAGVPPQ
jgi:hypothetical protein